MIMHILSLFADSDRFSLSISNNKGLFVVFQPGLGQPNLVAMAAQRQAKIERYRQKKELESQLETVKRAVDSGQADEDTTRQFYLLQLRRWISVSLEEVESIDQELPILKNMDFLQKSAPPSQPSRPPMKPFILTKDAVQVSSS